MKRNHNFFYLLLASVLIISAFVGYLAPRYAKESLQSKNNVECEVDCPDSIPVRLPGSIPGWVKYEDPEGIFSFEYPESWFYVVKQYHLYKNLMPVTSGLYSISREELEEGIKNPKIGMGIFRLPLNYTKTRPDRIYGDDGVMLPTEHVFIGKTDITMTTECLKVGIPYKGGVIRYKTQVCNSSVYIDLGDKGSIRVTNPRFENTVLSKDDLKVYEKILSTIKIYD